MSRKDSQESYLLVVNKHEDTLAYVDPASLEVVCKIPVGHDPHEMAITPDGRYAYISNYASPGNTISLVDLCRREHIAQIPTGRYVRIHGAVMAPDGRDAYFTAGQTGYLVEVSTEANRVTRAIPTGGKISHMVTISPTGELLYTANIESLNVSVIDRDSGRLITQVPCGRGCEGLSITPDGRHLWVANQGAGSITIIERSGHKVESTLECPGVPLRVAFTGDGALALIANWVKEGEAIIFDAPGLTEISRLRVGNQPIGIKVSPDQTRAFVSSMTSDEVHVIDLRSLEVIGRFETGRGPDDMAWWVAPART